MMNNLLIKYSQNHLRGRQANGFTLLELLIVFLLLSVITAIAIPSYLNQSNKARTAEAKMVLGAMNRSQHFYRVENGTFATTVEELKLRFSMGVYQNNAYYTPYYTYTVTPSLNGQEIHHFANPSANYVGDTNPLVAAVIWDNSIIHQIICEADSPNLNPTISSSGDCQDSHAIY